MIETLKRLLKPRIKDPFDEILAELGEPPDFPTYQYAVFNEKSFWNTIYPAKTFLNEEEADYELFNAIVDSYPRMYLPWLLGVNEGGDREFIELRGHHLLVAGQTRAGKTTQLNSAVVNLLHFSHDEYVKAVFLDPKKTGFAPLGAVANFATSHDDIVRAIARLHEELQKRIAFFEPHGKRDVDSINAFAYRTRKKSLLMPYVVIVFDEFPDFARKCKEGGNMEPIAQINSLAAMGAGCGFQFVFSTQAPYCSDIQGALKNNLSLRMAFALGDNQHDLLTLGSREKGEASATSLKQGEFLFKRSGNRAKFRSLFCSYESLKKAVENWQEGGWDWRLWKS